MIKQVNILSPKLYRPEQIDKIGNAIVYLMKAIDGLNKKNILKLLYILDEISIKKLGIPCLNLTYKVWKYGPVAEDIFIELSDEPTLLKNYIRKNEDNVLEPVADFVEDEFSYFELDLLNYVVAEFGSKTTEELVEYTHRQYSPWTITAKNNNVLNLLLEQKINNTDYEVDLSLLIQHDEHKLSIYEDYKTYH